MISFVKFNIIGILNTIVGYLIIFICMYFGLGPNVSNAVGYAVGLTASYCLNRRWSFASSNPITEELPKFLTVFLMCYLLNLAVLNICIDIFHISSYISQLISGLLYSVLFFMLSKLFVFKKSAEEGKAQKKRE